MNVIAVSPYAIVLFWYHFDPLLSKINCQWLFTYCKMCMRHGQVGYDIFQVPVFTHMTPLLWHWYMVKYCSYFFRVQVQCLLRGPEASVPIKVQVKEGLPLLFASLLPSTSKPSTGKSLA